MKIPIPTRRLTVTVHVLLLSTFLLSRPAFAQGPVGEWLSSEGRLTFVARADGTIRGDYEFDQGRMIGRLQGQHLVGFWHERRSEQRCESPRDGTHSWGRIVVTFSADWKTFAASWSYCDAEPSFGGWSGSAVQPQVAELQFGRREQGRFRPYATTEPMPYDRPFVVRVRYNVEPRFEQTGVTLTWGDGGEHRVVVFKDRSNRTIFESRDTIFEDPTACRGLAFCTAVQGVFSGR